MGIHPHSRPNILDYRTSQNILLQKSQIEERISFGEPSSKCKLQRNQHQTTLCGAALQSRIFRNRFSQQSEAVLTESSVFTRRSEPCGQFRQQRGDEWRRRTLHPLRAGVSACNLRPVPKKARFVESRTYTNPKPKPSNKFFLRRRPQACHSEGVDLQDQRNL